MSVVTLAPFSRMSRGVVSSLGTLISKSLARSLCLTLADSPAAHTLVPFFCSYSHALAFSNQIINQTQTHKFFVFFFQIFLRKRLKKKRKRRKRERKNRSFKNFQRRLNLSFITDKLFAFIQFAEKNLQNF